MKKTDLKVLPLDYWMTFKDDVLDDTCLVPIMPILKRNGYYLTKEMCWFEVDGKAYKYNKEYFEYELKLLNHRVLRDIEYKTIKFLITSKLADRKLKDLYWTERDIRYGRRMHF